MNSLHDKFRGTKYVLELANDQQDSYRNQPADLIGHFSHERSIADAYRGRQILELLQNTDDAGEDFEGGTRVLLRLTDSHLVVANTGHPFTPKGVRSLVVSDVSPKRLSRQRYIGNKGLGFRAILTWSSEPLIASGDFLLAFSPDHARKVALNLANELPELREEIDEWQKERNIVPAPTMRFPYVPCSDDERARLALAMLDEDYNTVIVLPINSGPRREQIRDEILRQLAEVTGETVLFCRNIKTLLIEGLEHRSWSFVREGSEIRQTVLVKHGDHKDRWTVMREVGTLPQELIEQELQETPEFEIAVGLPASSNVSESRRRLCVYFPTDDVLPSAMLAHATLATDDSRKRLIQHDANRFILKKLAELMAKAAEQESTPQCPHRGLELLAGVENCDPELLALGFRDAIIASCEVRNICPRMDGSVRTGRETMRPPARVWEDIADASVFPELYAAGAGVRVGPLLDALRLPWYDSESLGRRLELWVRRLTPVAAGRIVGQLLEAAAIPHGPPSLLLGSDGMFLPNDYTVFLTGKKGKAELPQWVQRFGFAHSEFVDAVRGIVGDTRDLRTRLNLAGYHTEEFQVESAARHLIQEAALVKKSQGFKEAALVRDILKCVYEISSPQSDTEGPIRAPLEVITTRGTVRQADDCYFGPAYPSGQYVFALYSPLGKDEFVASPAELNLAGDIEAVECFLRRIGVLGELRKVSIDYAFSISGFAEYILARLDYPNRVFGNLMESAAEACLRLSVSFSNLFLPDRFQEVLQKSYPEAVLAYVLSQGSGHLTDRCGATFQATQGSERTPRLYPAVNVPDPVYYLLQNQPWVPCDDGKRRPPKQLILSRTGRQVLSGMFFNHRLDEKHPLLANFSGGAAVEAVLRSLGAVYSLDSLRADEVVRADGGQLNSAPLPDDHGNSLDFREKTTFPAFTFVGQRFRDAAP